MKTRRPGDWVRHFETHRDGWREPDWAALGVCSLDDPRRTWLAESLAVFQLGESGGGTRLSRFVRRSFEAEGREIDAAYVRAVELFLAEENDHARYLEGLVGYLGGRLRRSHWMNGVFRRVRAALGLGFNLQVLLTAELIAEAYYGLLSREVPDPVVQSVCGRIVRDEAGHIGFHRTFFRWRHRGSLPGATAVWAIQFQLLYLVAETLVWSGHGRCLRAFGITRGRFVRRARAVCRGFLNGVAGGAGSDRFSREPHAGLVAGEPVG